MTDAAQSREYEALLKQSLVALKKAQTRIEALEQARVEPLAIVGVGCRFPGQIDDLDSFWRVVRDQIDTVTEVPRERWDIDRFYDPDPTAPGKIVTRWGAFLDQVDAFDAQFFGIARREALWMDPQQRTLLEVAWEAFEHAGLTRERLAGSQTGVFVGVCTNDFHQIALADFERIDAYASTGGAHSIIPNRLSYLLDLHGPSIAVDTACSSSLVAIHLACQSLRSGECDVALAGGVNMYLTPEITISFSKFGMMSAEGRCKSFDAGADGFVRGEGCGLLVLKRLSDAQRDGDTILALIRGTAVNQDGRSSGLTAPNQLAQQAVIRQALASAGLSADAVSYVEAHGTGTSLGDPIEVEALSEVYGRPRADAQICYVGSVKANLGHAEGAAGVAGVIKTLLALRERSIPPQANFHQLNPNIALNDTSLRIPATLVAWEPGPARPRLAGINGFSFGGTNAHVLLEEAPAVPAPVATPPATAPRLLPLSAHSPEALRAMARSYHALLTGPRAPAWEAICAGVALRRSRYDYRLAVVAADAATAAEQLLSYADEGREAVPGMAQSQPIVFVFSGHGSQWIGMGRELYRHEPVFRAAIDRCAAALAPHTDWSLDAQFTGDEAPQLTDVGVIQPTIFAVEVALAALWRAWGIEPDMVVGHSMGEVAAAHVAGALSLEDAARVISRRSALLRRVDGQGAMATVDLSLEEATALVAPYGDRLVVGLSNGPRSSVLSGEPAALDEVLARLEAGGIFCRRVNSAVAFHSPQMDPLCPELRRDLATLAPQPEQISFYSTVDAQPRSGTSLDAAYWVRNLREPVRFAATIQALLAQGSVSFLEVSPHPLLLSSLKQCARLAGRDGALFTSSLRRDQPERSELLNQLAALFTAGYEPRWATLLAEGARRVELPRYPWQRERFWLDIAKVQPGSHQPLLADGGPSPHPLLGQHLRSAMEPDSHFWERDLTATTVSYLQDHVVQGAVVVPATAHLELAAAALQASLPDEPWQLESVRFAQVLVLHSAAQRVQIALRRQGERVRFQIASRPADDPAASWVIHAEGLASATQPATTGTPLDTAAVRARCHEYVSGEQVYTAMRQLGYAYGPRFQGVAEAWYAGGEAFARLQLAESVRAEQASHLVHPALLDIGFHVLATTLLQNAAIFAAGEAYLPVGVERVERFRPIDPGDLYAYAVLHSYATLRAERHTGDVLLLNGAGELLVRVTGLQMQRLERSVPAVSSSYHELAWRPQPLPAPEPATSAGGWLILGDDDALRADLAAHLAAQGEHVVLAASGKSFQAQSANRYMLAPDDAADYLELLRAAFPAEQPPCRGIVLLWTAQSEPPASLAEVAAIQRRGSLAATLLIQALAQLGWSQAPRLMLVTAGAQAVADDNEPVAFAQASLWGLGRVIAQEQPGLRCVCIDLEPARQAAGEQLAAECLRAGAENQVAWRAGTRYAARLAPTSAAARRAVPAAGRAFQLDLGNAGELPATSPVASERAAPGPGMVELAIASALLERGPTARARSTGLCAGVVVATGPGVAAPTAGQPVLAFLPDHLGSHTLLPAAACVPIPAGIAPDQALLGALPATLAAYALLRLGRLRADDRVWLRGGPPELLHACVRLARSRGATVFVSEVPAAWRQALQSLGAYCVDDTASLAALCAGGGLHLVLKPAATALAPAELALLAPGALVLDLAPAPAEQGEHTLPANVLHALVDLEQLAAAAPELPGALIAEALAEALSAEAPLAAPRVALAEAAHWAASGEAAYALLALDDPRTPIVAGANAPLVRADGTYLITGGLGGLGLRVARRLAELGAGRLVLVSRRGLPAPPPPELLAELAAIEQLGATVQVAAADIADPEQAAGLLASLDTSGPPLRGVLHLAAVLDDGILLQLDAARLERVLAPKAYGAWNLHTLTADRPLDLFVLFSSVAALVGSPGQGNYAAANAFLDALAQSRYRAGLPGLSINWGPWAEVGMAAQVQRGTHLVAGGMAPIASEQGLAALEQLLRQHVAQAAVMEIDREHWRQSLPGLARMPFFAELLPPADEAAEQAGGGLRRQLELAEAEQRRELMEHHLHSEIVQVLGLAPSRVNERTPLSKLGFDSLVALDLRNRLEASLGLSLPVSLVWNYRSIAELAPYLLERLSLAHAPDALASEQPQALAAGFSDEEQETLAALLGELGELPVDALRGA